MFFTSTWLLRSQLMMAYFWALQAVKATEFNFARLLPRADGHYSAALAPTSAVMQMPQELFQMV